MSEKINWYVVHTYSGYENKVKANLEKTIENRGYKDLIVEITIPVEEVIEEKDGKRKITQKKKFPGYVLIKMIMTDDVWAIVRGTRGVTGFVGTGTKAIPLTNQEVNSMGIKEDAYYDLDIKVGETVKIISGQLQDFVASVIEINHEKHKLRGLVNMFGRETPVEVDFEHVRKLD